MNLLLQQLETLLANESDAIANAANTASFLFNNLEEINWAGFYFLKNEELVVGPFCGQVACTRIQIGSGVCGTSMARQETMVVDDVHEFDGHIACDVASQSEIVVPFSVDGSQSLKGVLDIDSPVLKRFGKDEKQFFEAVVKVYANVCTLA